MVMIVPPTKKAWVTLLTKDSYIAGALVMNASLVKHKTAYPFVTFVTPTLSQAGRETLSSHGIIVRDTEYLEPEDNNFHKVELAEESASRFAETWTKLRCFELVEYDRVILVDSDMLVTANMDELMDLDLPPGWIAAAHACTCNPRKLSHYPPEWIPASCAHTKANGIQPLTHDQFTLPTHHLINSGLVVLHPSRETFAEIVHILNTDPIVQTFEFPDQDLLSYAFKHRYLPLSYRYNALKTLRDCHRPMWKDEDVKNVHYIHKKPWEGVLPEEHTDYETTSWWWKAWDELVASWGDKPGRETVLATVKR